MQEFAAKRLDQHLEAAGADPVRLESHYSPGALLRVAEDRQRLLAAVQTFQKLPILRRRSSVVVQPPSAHGAASGTNHKGTRKTEIKGSRAHAP